MRRRAGARGNASTQAVLHRRLSFSNPNLTSITKIWGSSGGAGGVAFLSDGDGAIVVKNENDARDIVQVSAILSGVLGGQKRKKGKWSSKAPAARLATLAEVKGIKAAIARPGVAERGNRAFTIVGALTYGKAVLFESVPQPDFIKSFLGKQSKKKRFGKGRKARAGSAFKLLRNKKYLRTLGQVAAVDIFTGNLDRLAGMNNPQNWKIDSSQKAIILIDNLMNKGLEPFDKWKADPWTQLLVKGRYAEIATKIADDMREGAIWAVSAVKGAGLITDPAVDAPGAPRGKLSGKLTGKVRMVDENYVLSKIAPRLHAPLEEGVISGANLLLHKLEGMLDALATPNQELTDRYYHFRLGSSPSVRAKNKP